MDAIKLPPRARIEATEAPVLRAVLTAPIEEGAPLEEERETLRQAKAAGGWVKGATVSAEVAARARRAR